MSNRLNKSVDEYRMNLLNKANFGDDLDDLRETIKNATGEVEKSLEEEKIAETFDLIEGLDQEINSYYEKISGELLESYNTYKEAVKQKTESIAKSLAETSKELEDVADEVNNKGEEEDGGWFSNIFSGQNVTYAFGGIGVILSIVHFDKIRSWLGDTFDSIKDTIDGLFDKDKEDDTDKDEREEDDTDKDESKEDDDEEDSKDNDDDIIDDDSDKKIDINSIDREELVKFPNDYHLSLHEKYGYQESYQYLNDYYKVFSTDKKYAEDGSSRAATRTCLDKLKSETIIGARNLARYMRERVGVKNKPVITGGTEKGHAPGIKSHGNGWKLDIRGTDTFGKKCVDHFGLQQGKTKDITLFGQKLSFLYHGEGPHLDVTFNKIPNEWDYMSGMNVYDMVA